MLTIFYLQGPKEVGGGSKCISMGTGFSVQVGSEVGRYIEQGVLRIKYNKTRCHE